MTSTGNCWTSQFRSADVSKNDGEQFEAKTK